MGGALIFPKFTHMYIKYQKSGGWGGYPGVTPLYKTLHNTIYVHVCRSIMLSAYIHVYTYCI